MSEVVEGSGEIEGGSREGVEDPACSFLVEVLALLRFFVRATALHQNTRQDILVHIRASAVGKRRAYFRTSSLR